MVEDRADTFYVFDAGSWSSDQTSWVAQIETEDTKDAGESSDEEEK